MKREEEKWAIFWCELLEPIIFNDIEPEGFGWYLKKISQKTVTFPDGTVKKPSISLLRRKLKRYQEGGFNALARKRRSDKGKPRAATDEVIETAIELKKEQPYRSHKAINRFLKEKYGTIVPRSTLYRHLKDAGANRMKLGITQKKVRKRWTRDHTHDLWVGDFEEGPYVDENNETVPTYMSVFIDCHSRYVVDARYYMRQNLDILMDSLVRCLSKHGAPRELYLDNAKVYHSQGLKAACYKMKTRLIYRPKGDPAPGGLVERIIQTIQDQFEREVRSGDILSLEKLNRYFSAWLEMSYHKEIHSETGETPLVRYKKGLKFIRTVETRDILSSFMQRETRTVHKTFSDVRLNNRYYKVDPKLRGDRVEVRYDSFASIDTVEIYTLNEEYLGEGRLHFREKGQVVPLPDDKGSPRYNYLELLTKHHKADLQEKTKGIDYRKASRERAWSFHEFGELLADLLSRKGGLSTFNAGELESMKKTYNISTSINRHLVKIAFRNAEPKHLPYVILELKQLLKQKENK